MQRSSGEVDGQYQGQRRIIEVDRPEALEPLGSAFWLGVYQNRNVANLSRNRQATSAGGQQLEPHTLLYAAAPHNARETSFPQLYDDAIIA